MSVHKLQSNEQFISRYVEASRNFVNCLNSLFDYQYTPQFQANDREPTYPFTLLQSPHHYVVHFGPNEVPGLYIVQENIDQVYVKQQELTQQLIRNYQANQSTDVPYKTDPFKQIRQVKYKQNKNRKRKNEIERRNEFIKGIDQKSTKNIPKNYAKAVINFITKSPSIIEKVIEDEEMRLKFKTYLEQTKFRIQNIKQFSYMLSDNVVDPTQKEFNKYFRIISLYFLKYHAIAYIFNSRIVQESWHVKYRNDIIKALRYPDKFTKVKFK